MSTRFRKRKQLRLLALELGLVDGRGCERRAVEFGIRETGLAEIGAGDETVVRLITPHLTDATNGTWARELLARTSPEEARRQLSALIPQLEEILKDYPVQP